MAVSAAKHAEPSAKTRQSMLMGATMHSQDAASQLRLHYDWRGSRNCRGTVVNFAAQSYGLEELAMLSTRTALRLWLTLILGAAVSAAFGAGGGAAPNLQVLQRWNLGGA